MKKNLFLLFVLVLVIVTGCSNSVNNGKSQIESSNSETIQNLQNTTEASSEQIEDSDLISVETSDNEIGITLQVKVGTGTYRFKVFRKGPNDTDFEEYGEVTSYPDSFLSDSTVKFNDPFVEAGENYSYKIQFSTEKWWYNSDSMIMRSNITAPSGNGELTLLNIPEFEVLIESNEILIKRAPEFKETPSHIGIKIPMGNGIRYQYIPYDNEKFSFNDIKLSDYDIFQIAVLYSTNIYTDTDTEQYNLEEIYINSKWMDYKLKNN